MTGRHWLIEAPLDQVWPGANLQGLRPKAGRDPRSWHRELAALACHFPEAALLVDLETCGFSGSAVFLIGLVYSHRGKLFINQLLARDYSEERAILGGFWQRMMGQRVLVSFNGKSFDWPMIQDRTALHRLDFELPDEFVHCDILHHARRRWRDQLPDCRLQTLEQRLCGRHRAGDIPGARVPETYHRYVRSGEGREMQLVLHHNLLDLITLVQLAAQLLDECPKRKGLPTASTG
jgi:uncharacterized protein YprB with RNaseH-like and TPR domain